MQAWHLAVSMVLVVLKQNGFMSPSNPNPYPQDIWQCWGTFLAITVGMVVGAGGSTGIQLVAAEHNYSTQFSPTVNTQPGTSALPKWGNPGLEWHVLICGEN